MLRQDPDVILIGEMRDLETISVALTAAETGHLVFATLHTQNAAQTIDRIIDVFPPHQQDQIAHPAGRDAAGRRVADAGPEGGRHGPCHRDRGLITTPAISNLIREGKSYQITSSMQAGRALGMHTMDQHLADLVNEGEITREAAFEKAHDPDSLERLIRREDLAGSDLTFDPSAFDDARASREALIMSTAVKNFAYTSRNDAGKVVKGKVEAPSEAAALTKIRGLGLQPVSVDESAAGTGLQMEIKIPGFEKGVDLKALAIMSRQMATMISSGLSLLKALSILEPDREQEARRHPAAGHRRRRDRRIALGRVRQVPGRLPTADDQHDPRR